MLTNRRRLTLAGLTVALAAFSMVLVASGPQAEASHIPDTGPIPANCVEFQQGVTGPKTVLGVTITVNSWSNTPADPHTVNFTISGLPAGQQVDISVKSGTFVQESSYGNGTYTVSTGLQNAISHIRFCVFTSTTTTSSTSSTTSSTTTSSTTTSSTTTTTDPTTTTDHDHDSADHDHDSADDVDDRPGTTSTTDPGTTSTTDPGTTSTTDEVEGTVITSTTMGDEVAGTTIVADELPFTGFDGETLGQLALIILALGVLTLLGAQAVRARSNDES